MERFAVGNLEGGECKGGGLRVEDRSEQNRDEWKITQYAKKGAKDKSEQLNMLSALNFGVNLQNYCL